MTLNRTRGRVILLSILDDNLGTYSYLGSLFEANMLFWGC